MAQYKGRVRFVVENFGESQLAARFGIKRYPAVFVDDVLVAKPNDFGFFGADEKAGRYTPWLDAASHEKFKRDLARMIDLDLAGKKQELREERATPDASNEITRMPRFSVSDLAGKSFRADDVSGRVVVVEFWATWCPPCHEMLARLEKLRASYGDKLTILALAVDSPEDQVRKTAKSFDPTIHWALATPEVARAFGDVIAVPTVLVFDRSGKAAGSLLGAPPNVQEAVQKLIEATMH